ncbi:hypothetical protein GCM10009680_50570 [Streptomyces yatensis]|uniref:Uncharacterized protein n=1 Tax=Streptomyces yatensis TaxID=155177 RepID=A0ABN2IEG4_9ACTN
MATLHRFTRHLTEDYDVEGSVLPAAPAPTRMEWKVSARPANPHRLG